MKEKFVLNDQELSVDTEVLCDGISRLKEIYVSVAHHTENFSRCIETSASVWESKSAEFAISLYRSEKEENESILAVLSERAGQLQAILDNYHYAERKNTALAESLPDAII